MTESISVRGLSHAFNGRLVLDDVSFGVTPDGITALVGPSGCGKSTLFKVLAGLLIPQSGAADVGDASAIGRTGVVSFMPQRDHLLPWKRTIDNAIVGARIGGVAKEQARAQARALLETFGLDGAERSWPSELSGGMRQRLALLRTFLVGRNILLLDEPFGALDGITRRSMHTWLQCVLAETPRTVLLITHDVEEALTLADQVVVLSSRPARVLATFPVPLARPRAAEVVTTPNFVELKREVLAVLDA